MALRSNHYDVAFEAYIRSLRRPYVAVDETRRALLQQASLKSMDFIVYSPQQPNLLVDVKGRRFPSGAEPSGRCWDNWTTVDDIESLKTWEQVFGPSFRGLFVFAYDVREARWRQRHAALWEFRQRTYAFYGVWVDDYAAAMRTRSPRWETVSLPARDFHQLRMPLAQLL